MNDIYEELIELQTRITYQEDTIAQLNQVVTRQDAEILLLKQQMLHLAKRFDELSFAQEQGDVANERPPHY